MVFKTITILSMLECCRYIYDNTDKQRYQKTGEQEYAQDGNQYPEDMNGSR